MRVKMWWVVIRLSAAAIMSSLLMLPGCSLLFPTSSLPVEFVPQEQSEVYAPAGADAECSLSDGAQLRIGAQAFWGDARLLFTMADITGEWAERISREPSVDLLSPCYLVSLDSVSATSGPVEISIPVAPDLITQYADLVVLAVSSSGKTFVVESTINESTGLLSFETPTIGITQAAAQEFNDTVLQDMDAPPLEMTQVAYVVVGIRGYAMQTDEPLGPCGTGEVSCRESWLPIWLETDGRCHRWEGDLTSSLWVYVYYPRGKGLEHKARALVALAWNTIEALEDLGIERPSKRMFVGIEIRETGEFRGWYSPRTNAVYLQAPHTDDEILVAHELTHWFHYNHHGALRKYIMPHTCFVEAVANWAAYSIHDERPPRKGLSECYMWSPFIIDDSLGLFGVFDNYCGKETVCFASKYDHDLFLYFYSESDPNGTQLIVDAINAGESQPYDGMYTEENWLEFVSTAMENNWWRGTSDGLRIDFAGQAVPLYQGTFPQATNKSASFLPTRPQGRLDLGPMTAYSFTFSLGRDAGPATVTVERDGLDDSVEAWIVTAVWPPGVYTGEGIRSAPHNLVLPFEFAHSDDELLRAYVYLFRGGEDFLGNRLRDENYTDIRKSIVVRVRPPPPELTASVSPEWVDIPPGDYHPVTYTFREEGGCEVNLTERTGQFFMPGPHPYWWVVRDPLTPESARMHQSITVPANGETAWDDNIYMPPDVAEEARRWGYDRAVLRARFYGTDCSGNEISVSADLLIIFDEGCPDLTMQDIWVVPEDFSPGETVSIHFRARNVGDASAGPFRVAILFDGQPIGSGTVDGMSPGQVITGKKDNFTWPSDSACHTITVQLDTENAVQECREDNNTMSRTFCPTEEPPDLPDLIIESIDFGCPQDLPPDFPISWTCTPEVVVRNIGAATARGPFKVTLSAWASDSDVDLGCESVTTIQQLLPGERYVWKVDECSSPVWQCLRAVVDPDGVVEESNEDNNTLEVCYEEPVELPDLVVDSIEITGCGWPLGEDHLLEVFLLVSVKNIGGGSAGPFSVQVRTITDPQEIVCTKQVAGLPAGTTTLLECSVPISAEHEVRQYVTVRAIADVDGEIQEIREDNNTRDLTFDPLWECIP